MREFTDLPTQPIRVVLITGVGEAETNQSGHVVAWRRYHDDDKGRLFPIIVWDNTVAGTVMSEKAINDPWWDKVWMRFD